MDYYSSEDSYYSSDEIGPRRKALILGIIGSVEPHHQRKHHRADPTWQEGHTKGPHGDAFDMRQALINLYDYDEEDITIIIDDGLPYNIQPTEENVLIEMANLVADARPGDQFFLHYSGHGTRLPDDNGDEEDGWDECIITCDDKAIRDDKLKEIMVDRLPAGCSFFSVFDACHSGTILDLPHYRCNRVYVPWVSKGIPRDYPFHADHHAGHLPGWHPKHHMLAHPTTLPAREVAKLNAHAAHLPHPDHHFCKGLCRDDPYFIHDTCPAAHVISLSAAKDYQLSWAGRSGTSLTQALIQVLECDRNPTFAFLLKSVSHKIHESYLELHYHSHIYQEWLRRVNLRRQQQGKPHRPGRRVETENFQDPQISSHRPLDEDEIWEL